MVCLNCNRETSNPKFCSRSCAVSYNNTHYPKKRLEGKCKLCGAIISKTRKYCKKCNSSNKGGRPSIIPDKYCPNCGIKIPKRNKYCSQQCGKEHRFQQKIKLVESRGYFYKNRTHTNAPLVKQYLRYKFGDKCSICNTSNIWNNKPIVLILDHIDGHHNNWKIDNLRLVCPNCDSQLPTFKNRNHGNGRPRK